MLINKLTTFHISKLRFDKLTKTILNGFLPASLEGIVAGFNLDSLVIALACSAFSYATDYSRFLEPEDVIVIATFLDHSDNQIILFETLLDKLNKIDSSHDWEENIDSLTEGKAILKKEIDGNYTNIKQADVIRKIKIDHPL